MEISQDRKGERLLVFCTRSVRMLAFVLALLFALSIAPVGLAADAVQYTATATSTLKVRAEASKYGRTIANIAKGERVDILALGEEYSNVIQDGEKGYVLTKYITDLKGVGGNEVPLAYIDYVVEEFRPIFQARPSRNIAMYKQPTTASRKFFSVKEDTLLQISWVREDWAYARVDKYQGYVQTKYLVQYDTIDPYAGPVPGVVCYPHAVTLRRATKVYDAQTKKKVLFTMQAGAVISAEAADADGWMQVPYMKVKGVFKAENAFYIDKVVPWADAQPGDLISTFSTFFPLPKSNKLIVGRVFNIYYSCGMLMGLRLNANEDFSLNGVIGPYKKSNGYRSAPIASRTTDQGYGGGTCQTSTTLYNTLLQVPLLVTKRQVHSSQGAKYAPVGFDAAVGSGDRDTRFRNTLPYDITMAYYVSDGVMTYNLYRAY